MRSRSFCSPAPCSLRLIRASRLPRFHRTASIASAAALGPVPPSIAGSLTIATECCVLSRDFVARVDDEFGVVRMLYWARSDDSHRDPSASCRTLCL